MQRIKVMLVEDHVLVREGTRELLEREDDLCVVAQAGDGQEAVRQAGAHHPDVILMDIALPEISGLEATRQIKAADPQSTILVLSAYDDDEYVFAFLEAGAAGYLLKDVSANELVKAIRAVYAGESVLHPTITRKVVDYFAGQRTARQTERTAAHLTDRELEVLIPRGQGVAGEVTRTGSPFRVENYQTYPGAIRAFADAGLVSVLSVPIVVSLA